MLGQRNGHSKPDPRHKLHHARDRRADPSRARRRLLVFSMTLSPPNIADLAWSHDHTAIATEGYWELHRTGKAHLARAGLRVEKDGGGKWRVRFRPETTTPDAIRDGIAAAREARVVTSISMSDLERQNREASEQRRREWEAGRPAREAERQRQLEAVEARRRERVREVQAMGRHTLKKWGEF